jgi:competence protein ComEC
VGWWTLVLLGAVAGAALQLQQPVLWPAGVYAALGLLAGVLAWGAWRARCRAALLCGAAMACAAALAVLALTGLRASHFAAGALNPALEGQDIQVTGIVAAMPQPIDAGLRLRLAVESAHLAGAPVDLPARIDLGWYHGLLQEAPDSAQLQRQPLPLRAGERWQMTVRLKAPHGARNPHGFDYELWLWEQGVQATGYVRAGLRDAPPRRIAATWRHPVERARQAVRDAIFDTLAPDATDTHRARLAGVVAALVTGDQRAIDLEADIKV